MLDKQASGLVIAGGALAERHLIRMNKTELITVLSDFDAKELRIKTYQGLTKPNLIAAYAILLSYFLFFPLPYLPLPRVPILLLAFLLFFLTMNLRM